MDSCPEKVHFLFNKCCIHHFGSLEFTLAFFSATKFNQNSDPTPELFPLQPFHYPASSGFCPRYQIRPSLLLISEMGPLTKVNRVLISIKSNSPQVQAPSANFHLQDRVVTGVSGQDGEKQRIPLVVTIAGVHQMLWALGVLGKL